MHSADELADIEAHDRAMAEPGEAIPADFVRRMVDCESPLRVFRDLRGLTQAGLAERSGVNRVHIADIEVGRKSGSVQTLRRLAEALGVAIDDLV